MSILKFSVGKSGAGGANSDYITRLSAAEKISFHNLPELESEDVSEARTNAIAYAHSREEIELARNPNGRTHYRLIFSWEGKEIGDEAIQQTKEFLSKEFPDGRAIIAVHQDTDDTHTHVWLDTRKTNNQKIQIERAQYETLDERWTRQYDANYGTSFAPNYKAKKEETKQYKREMAEWRKAQAEDRENAALTPEPVKPERAADRLKPDYWRTKEMQALSGTRTLSPAGADSSAETVKPVEKLIEEKKIVIEKQVESYLLDLKKMMRERREMLIKDTYRACYSNLIRRGIPTEKLREYAVAAVDHITDKGSYQVRERIREQIEQGTHLDGQINLADKSGGEAVHNILRNAADASHNSIVELTLGAYEKDFRDVLKRGFSFEYKPGQIKQIKEETINEKVEKFYEQNGFAAGHRLTQGAGRSAQIAERIAAGEEPASSSLKSSERRGDQSTSLFESPESRGTQLARRIDQPERRGAIATESAEQSINRLSGSNDFARRAVGEDFSEPKNSEFNSDPIKGDELKRASLRNFSDRSVAADANPVDLEGNIDEQFYGSRFAGFESSGNSGSQLLLTGGSGAEAFAIIPIPAINLPDIEFTKPQIKLNTEAVVLEMTKMMSEHLRAQQDEISERAWFILQNQWRADALKPATPGSAGSTGASSQLRTSLQQATDDEADSKLEQDFQRLKNMKDASERRAALNDLADHAEQDADWERKEKIDKGLYDDEKKGKVRVLTLEL